MSKILAALSYVYDRHYKLLLLIPNIIILLAIAQIISQIALTGDFVNKGITLKGGVAVTISERSYDLLKLDKELKEAFPKSEIAVRAFTNVKGIIIEAADINVDDLISELKKKFENLSKDEYNVEQIGSALGKSFFKETFRALVLAFVFMAVVVFVTFRTLVPSLAVILAAASDILVTLAIFNLTGLKLSTSGVAALLMLIGYSVDTDILLTSRVLKRQDGTVLDGTYSAIKTGLLMTATALSAIMVALAISMFLAISDTIFQIMLILFIGLMVDTVMTWIQNAGILRYYLEKKEVK